MKLRTMLGLFAGLVLFAGFAVPQSKPATGFDQLKTLAGEWEGKTENGKSVRVYYKVISGGSALLETLAPGGEPEMLTVYNLDGNHVMLTHYCSAGNQPRMRALAATPGAKEFNFAFLDATNLASPAAGHMHKLAIRLEDNDHFTQRWTWRDNGKEATEVFHFTRKK